MNEKLLAEFTEYCKEHPGERFWQALRNWSQASAVWYEYRDSGQQKDTFYWNNKDKF